MRKELFAAIFLGILLTGAGLLPVAGRFLDLAGRKPIELAARTPENGGWSHTHLEAEVSKPLYLRITSEDVMHSFAIGQSDQPAIDLLPGEVVETELVFDRPGTYTYYCTRWCGPNHWRMRGTILVRGEGEKSGPGEPPLYVQLGIDLDAPFTMVTTPNLRPSPARGKALGIIVPQEYTTPEYLRSHSPYDLFQALGTQSLGKNLSDQELWDLTAATWMGAVDPQQLAEGRLLYAQNCAACHGESGAGDGVMADDLASVQASDPSAGMGEMTPLDGHSRVTPTDFTDLAHRLGRGSAALQGKILRGGMGTGMPSWGSIFSESQTWSLVDALWALTFDE